MGGGGGGGKAVAGIDSDPGRLREAGEWMMDGRDFGPPRSVHGPPPLLSGLAMESHRLGATGRLAPAAGPMAAGLPAALQPGKFLASGISLHSHPGKAPRNPRAFPAFPPRDRALNPTPPPLRKI